MAATIVLLSVSSTAIAMVACVIIDLTQILFRILQEQMMPPSDLSMRKAAIPNLQDKSLIHSVARYQNDPWAAEVDGDYRVSQRASGWC